MVVSLLLAVLHGTSAESPTLCRKERERNQFQASAETLKDVSLDAIDGTDVQGWNRAPQHSVIWSDLNVYIIRAYGDCQKEVNVLYTSVLPKIRQVLSSCAVNVQFRDLGSISRPLPEARPEEKRPQIGISLKSIKERNSVCIVLVGFDYGEPWKHTCGSETLKELGLDDSEEIEFAEEMSELEILATRAAQESEIKHTVFTSRMSVPRTFMYTCVDPDSPFRYQGGFSPTRSNFVRLVTMTTQLCSFDAIVVQTERCTCSRQNDQSRVSLLRFWWAGWAERRLAAARPEPIRERTASRKLWAALQIAQCMLCMVPVQWCALACICKSEIARACARAYTTTGTYICACNDMRTHLAQIFFATPPKMPWLLVLPLLSWNREVKAPRLMALELTVAEARSNAIMDLKAVSQP
jgi:hypothetical protein